MMSRSDHYITHVPVLRDKAVSELVTDCSGIYVDATLGGGGHSKAILKKLSPEGQLIGLDQDDEALQEARNRLGRDARFSAIKGNFGFLSTLIPPEFRNRISGILFDLGVSTHQISEPERGFSFQQEGPLDMRMGNLLGKTAYDVLNTYEYKELRDIIFHYGEEKKSREIARAIIDGRPIEHTKELADIVKQVARPDQQVKSLARVFQAIRIEVNRELDMLKQALEQCLELLQPSGRIVAISYHSLEDRIVKRFFKAGNHRGKVEKDIFGNSLAPISPVYNNIIRPDEKEIQENPPARSAKMRVAEKRKPKED